MIVLTNFGGPVSRVINRGAGPEADGVSAVLRGRPGVTIGRTDKLGCNVAKNPFGREDPDGYVVCFGGRPAAD